MQTANDDTCYALVLMLNPLNHFEFGMDTQVDNGKSQQK